MRLEIYGTNDTFVFFGRHIHNPFGFCQEYDLLKLKELAEYLQNY